MSERSPRQQEHRSFLPLLSEHLSEYLREARITVSSQTRPLWHSTERSLLEQLAPPSRWNAAPLNTLRHKRGSRPQALDILFPGRQLVYFHFNRRLCDKFNRRPFNRGSDNFN